MNDDLDLAAWVRDAASRVELRPPLPGATGAVEARHRGRSIRPRRRAGVAVVACVTALGLPLIGLSGLGRIWPAGGGGTCRAPAPSTAPIGTLGAIAYLRDRALRVVDLSTGLDRSLAAGAIGNVRWSPDGRWIALGDGSVVAAAGGDICRPLGRPAVSWSWSPASDELSGVTASGGLVVGRPGVEPRMLLPRGWGAVGDPLFDPTGRFVAVGRIRTDAAGIPVRGSLWIVDLATGRARELLRVGRALPIVAGWSPDSSWVLWWDDVGFSASLAADGLTLRATSVDGSTTERVVAPVLVHPDLLSWCGDRLVVAAGGFRDVRSGKRFVTASAPTWRASDLSRDPSRSWIWPACSPDGRWVAATAGFTPPPQERFGLERRTIWLVASDGSGNRRLLSSSGAFANDFPRWSSDGGTILFVRRTLDREPSAALFMATVDPSSGAVLGVRGPVANLGPVSAYAGGYGYYGWSGGTDWFRPNGS